MSEGIELPIVSVVGAGTMGSGIAQVFAMKGYDVFIVDVSEEIIKKAIERIKWSLNKLVIRGEISEKDVDVTLNKIKTTTSIAYAVKNSGLVIEAVPEDLSIKIAVFKEVDKNAPRETIIASNTSGLPIAAMAEVTSRPNKVIGMHWFNPPQIMRLIEVIKSKYTDDESANAVMKISYQLGKIPILVKRDIRGFVANRLYRTIRYESFAMVLRGEYTPIEIDSMLKYKLKFPMGVFELADFTGVIEIEILEDKHFKELRNRYPEWEPHEEYVAFREYTLRLSKRYYEANLIGVKTGKGFYQYPEPGKYAKPNIPESAGEKVEPLNVLAPAINLAVWIVAQGIATSEECDLALKLGYNLPKGLIELGREYGVKAVTETLEYKMKRYKDLEYSKFYNPHPALQDILK